MSAFEQSHDSGVLHKIKLGDEDAFAALFETQYVPLVNFIYAFVKDVGVSQDLAQDAFVKLWEYRLKLDPSSSPLALLRTIGKRLALNELRHIAYDERARAQFWEKIQGASYRVDEQADFEELMGVAAQRISLLPPRQQEVFRMSREEGLSHEEIAKLLKISKHTVNNLIVQAVKTLKSSLKQAGFLFLLLFNLW